MKLTARTVNRQPLAVPTRDSSASLKLAKRAVVARRSDANCALNAAGSCDSNAAPSTNSSGSIPGIGAEAPRANHNARAVNTHSVSIQCPTSSAIYHFSGE